MEGSPMKCVPIAHLAIFAAIAFVGCTRCGNEREAALQAVLPQIDQAVASNLVNEASLAIASAFVQKTKSGDSNYLVPRGDAPVAYGLKTGSEMGDRMGNAVSVDLFHASAPQMTIKIPIHYGGFCWWQVLIFVKPGGGFVKNSDAGYMVGGFTNENSFVRISDEILLWAGQRSP